MKKRAFLRSCTAIVLVLALVLGYSGGLVAYAEETSSAETLNYVSIGDSMSNGYGFVGYNQDSDDLSEYNFLSGTGMYGADAYPLQFEAYLKGLGYAVEHTKLAPSALLAGDFWFLLGGRDEPNDEWGGFRSYVGKTYKEDDAKLKEHVQTAVAGADVMTLCLGNAEFGAYLLNRITDALGVLGGKLDDDEKVTLQDALNYSGLDEEQQSLVQEVYDMLVNKLKSYIPNDLYTQYNIEDICNLLAYTTAGFLFNYKGAVNEIISMNPDVEIVQVGLMNTTYGMTVTMEDGSYIPVGDIMDGVFGLLNAYVAGLPTVMQLCGEWQDATFYYAEQPAPLFISQQFAALKEANWGVIDNGRLDGGIVRERNIKAYNDSLRSVLSGEFSSLLSSSSTLPKITLNDVQDFEAYRLSDSTKCISCAIYLGIEDAVAESTDTLDIPLSALEMIVNNISAAFTGFEPTVDYSGNNGANIYQLRTDLGNYLTSSDDLKGMCKIYALFKVGNGMSVHPTPSGHDNIAAAVIDAYESGYTAADKTKDNLLWAAGALADLVAEYYDEAYAYAYGYAKDAGYIDAVKQSIAAVQAELAALEIPQGEMTDAFYAELVAELKQVNSILDSAMTLVDAADQLDQDAFNALMDLLNECSKALDGLATLAAQAEDDTVKLVLLPVLEKAEYELKTNIIPQAQTAIDEIWQAAYDYLAALVDKAGSDLPEAYDALVKALEENAKELGIQLGDWAYDYLTNNADKVIAFFAEYGDNAVDFLSEYQAEILAVVGFLSANYGNDVLEYVLDNADSILSTMAKWVNTYGQDAWALIKVYLGELGLLQLLPTEEELRTAIAAVEAIIAQCYDQLEDASLAAMAELEQYLPVLEAEAAKLRSMLESYTELLDAQLSAQLEAALEDLNAALEELESKAAALKEAIEAEVQEQLPIAKAAFEEALRQVEAALKQLKDDAEGAVASVKEAIGQLYNTLKPYQEPITDALNATIALLNEAVDTLEKVLNEHAGEIEATVLPQLLQTVRDIQAELESLEEVLRTATDATAEELINATQKALNQLLASVEDLLETADGQVSQIVAEAMTAFEQVYLDAISADYTVSKDSYYVAIGDDTLATDNSYANALADELKISYDKVIADSASKALALVKSDADVQAKIVRSDLVTLGFSNNAMLDFMVETVQSLEPVTLDWSVFGYDQLNDRVAEAMDKLQAALEEKVQDATQAAMLRVAVESYAYAYTTHLMAYPMMAEAIHKINPDTLVVLVGMSNALEDVVLTNNGEEIPLGDYVQYLIDAANIEALAYAMLSDNTIYVEAPDTQTKLDARGASLSGDLIGAISKLLSDSIRSLLDPSPDGHAYIKEQILGTLDVEQDLLWGDANGDGTVNSTDARLVLQYSVDLIGETDLHLSVCDVNGDGTVNSTDARLILQYSVDLFSKFPVEE